MKAERIFRTSVVSLALRTISAGVTYLFLIALARTTDTADFGIVGTIISASLLFSIIASAGQRIALLRFVPGPLAKGDHRQLGGITSASFRVALFGNAVMYLLLAGCVVLAGLMGRLEHWAAIAWGLLVVPLTGIIDMQAHLARAYRHVVLALVPKDILWRLISGTVLAALFFLWDQRPLTLATVLSILVGVLASLIILQGLLMGARYRIPSAFAAAFAKERPDPGTDWRNARTPLWIASVAGVAFSNLDVIVVGLFLGSETAALYFAANRIAMIPVLFLVSQNIALGPAFSMHYASGQMDRVHRDVVKASLFTFVPTLCTAALLAVLAGPALSLFGSEFGAARDPLYILLASGVLAVAFGPNELVLTMCGQEAAAMRIAVWSTSIGALSILISTIWQTAEAVALGVFFAQCFMRGFAWLTARRVLGFSGDIISATIVLLGRTRSRAAR